MLEISAELLKDRKGNIKGVVVYRGKKKASFDTIGQSIVVATKGNDISVLGFPEVDSADEYIDRLTRAIKKYPERHLGNSDYIISFRLDGDLFAPGLNLYPAREARIFYDNAQEIAKQFRVALNCHK